ncbi:hypothetical protein [Paludisphaera mucosa]|uniref:Uncharacterized protein n=1 Tax=Paludisphaera mucosa TaxID=3030827 RepID=A0ABT6FGI4_9BACT|nr:hypothetical protein [Paludisphaera mucosa]MDG3006523.1 hypothetical protein [Paludisphaera mucosa]
MGLTVASFDAPYLLRAIRAMADAGKPDAFDFLCIHPYEIADGLSDPDGEIPFLGMTRLLRDALRDASPGKADAEIWITEIGRRLDGQAVKEVDAARALVKLYAMAMAQGVARTLWFEARDPAGEEPGFGLIDRAGRDRESYKALRMMAKMMGPTPRYLGWLALGVGGRGYGFLFECPSGPVLVAWMPAGATDNSLAFDGDVSVAALPVGLYYLLRKGQQLPLTNSPVILQGIPRDLVAQAQRTKPFPWGGDHSRAKRVVFEADGLPTTRGLHQVRGASTPPHLFPDGSTGVRLASNQAASFYVHPSFAALKDREFYVRVAVRRLGPGNLGMNLRYEVADGQGANPYRNRGDWFAVSDDPGWQTHTWRVADASFAKMWGYDFSFVPEQSVPFVIGKVEVSKTPFE